MNISVGPLHDQSVKDALRDKVIAEKLKAFFEPLFTTEDTEEIPMPEHSFLVNRTEELDHSEVK